MLGWSIKHARLLTRINSPFSVNLSANSDRASQALQSRPDLHFTSYQTSHWRFLWAEIFRLEEHLEKHKLIKSPNDNNDIFYHIPVLEDGYNTAGQIRSLLSRTGFKGDSQRFLGGGPEFLQRHLPSLLHRDVWEKVTGLFPLQYYWHILYLLDLEIPSMD
ncbi:hypothetical protein BGZ63DRAFT_409781 [Mariannaea sp. PMI_226]|nr:hypothetical protein BGZ63DRAFT_409781 [Mariannaea sp. PMI_226]